MEITINNKLKRKNRGDTVTHVSIVDNRVGVLRVSAKARQRTYSRLEGVRV